ncbi:granulin b isoform X2 [Pangasianodon hypophthalmus]|uniref:granulin b isoform X2 n=1 Tax=Pangasianodon hypophthalmus TaxID=310915 RepID=UPI0023076383|nr:granulin b isoform X2 [Pangasianodon hypophthalmus]
MRKHCVYPKWFFHPYLGPLSSVEVEGLHVNILSLQGNSSQPTPKMRASVCMLVCVLSVCSALICPDGGMCDDGNTCCQTSGGGYGCCPLPNAECCSDHLHCCHEGTLCDMEHGTCVNKTHTLEWVRRVVAKQTTLPQAVVCPDQESECPDDTTCCQMPDGTWGCCPMPNAVCCEDKRHCCPAGTTCDLPHSRCVSSTLGSTPLLRKFPAIHVGGKRDAVVKEISVKFPDSNDVVCPDKVSTCPDDTTCCILANGSYGCCPLPNAVCCDDYVHCCPEGTTCDLEHSTCVLANELTTMTAEAPPILLLKPTVDSVPCNDTVACATGFTCCKKQDSEWGCCPLPEAVCCEDHIHCCPHGTVCDLSEGTCNDPTDLSHTVPLVKKVPAFPRPSQPANQKCDESFSCPQDATCCKLASGAWGCCPLPQAVCCEDHLHCCPHDTVCNVAAGTCDSVPDAGVRLTVPWVSKTPAVALMSESERCDETSACPTGTTCCKEKSGTWACCQLPRAVCCEDHEHCCPQGYKCDVAHKSCEHPSLPSMPWVRKQPALSVTHSSYADPSANMESQHGHKCDAQTTCPRGNTCCYMAKLSKWGCCPLPQAVCCGDGDHCCPSGYTCDKEKPVCTKGNLQIAWFEKQPAMIAQGSEVTRGLGDVKCDNTTSCAAGTTCCRLRTGKWGCCPLVKAVCCEDHEHCCPQGYTCDLQSGTCIKPSTTHTLALTLVHTLSEQDEDEVMCDATRRCPKSQTCCRIPDNEWACCPFEQAVCCKDMKHCCPKGYTCDPEKRCTKASPFTWWDNLL